jgi:hypothetical protein
MKARRGETRKIKKAGGDVYVFMLFVAGNESNSMQARANLARLCAERLNGRY